MKKSCQTLLGSYLRLKLTIIFLFGSLFLNASVVDSVCWSGATGTCANIVAKTVWTVDDTSITLRTYFPTNFVDNTYGTNAIGWPSGHTFSNLTGSDMLQMALFNGAGAKVLEFKIDYLSSSGAVPSGYKSLGVTGGDGAMLVGVSSNIYSATTSLDVNFNQYGYILTTNSPATNANYSPNPNYPNWIYEVWYEVKVKKSAFGASGFGYPTIPSVHASPSKCGNNTAVVVQTNCPSSCPVTATASANSVCPNTQVTLTATGNGNFQWSNGATTASTVVSPAATTTYTVTLTNGACSSISTVTVSTSACGTDSVCWSGSVGTCPSIIAKTVYTVADSTVTLRTYFPKNFVDNTYGTGAVGWPSGHTFSNLTGSDKLQMALYNAANTKVLEFNLDYISASGAAVSGYKSLGVTGGDGGMLVGSASNILNSVTSLDVNFNQFGYILTTNSPATNASYTPNPTYPNWIYEVWYEVTVRKSVFGASGFGHVTIPSVHASPSKCGNNTAIVVQVSCPCDNVAVNAGPNVNLNCMVASATIGTAPLGGYTYSWSPATGLSSTTVAQPTASPNATTIYTVTVTTGNSCTGTSTVTVNVNKIPPTADSGPNKNHNCTITSSTIGTVAIVGNTYSWSPATGLSSTTVAQPTASPLATTTYTLTVTGTNGCTATSTVIVNVNTTPPTADAGPNKNHNCTITSSTIGTVAIVGNTYSWSPATGLSSTTVAQPTASPLATTTYTLTVTGTNGCTATSTVTVNVNTTPPTADAGPDKNHNCTITSSTIGTVAIVGNTYSWSPATGLSSTTVAQPTASPLATTTYTLTVTGTNGCTATSTVTVNVNTTPPTADAGPAKTIDCHILSVQIGTVSIVGNSYSWSPGNTLDDSTLAQPTANPIANTIYTVTVTGANGCTATSTVAVIINQVPPTPIISGNMEVCNGSTTTLTVSGAGTYLWSTGSTNTSIIVGEGTYTVTATDGVCVGSTTAIVNRVEGTIGNYVWHDINLDGIQNESSSAGINGVSVQLWDAGADMTANTNDDVLLQTTTTSNDNNNNPGYYKFIVCNSGNYFVKFPSSIEEMVTTISNPTAGIDLNSDINPEGYSPVFNIDVYGVGVSKDNNTIDAGYIDLKYIGNFVWNDKNRDGIQDIREVGVAGVTVALLDAQNNILATTATDAYGYYYFSSMKGGSYKIAFTLPAGFVFSPQNQGGNIELDSDVDPTTGITDLFSYTTGVIDLTFDAGIYLPTPLKAEIGDRVWNDVNKNGIQDSGETGIAGVTVTLYDDNNTPIAFTVTNADGYYFFQNLEPGTYAVGFSLPIGYIFTTPNQGGNFAADSDPNTSTGRTSPITVVAGEVNHTVDAGMYPQPPGLVVPGSIGNFVWNDVNNNGLQDPNEGGIMGVRVNLLDSLGALIATTYTDIFGYYIFNNLPPGKYFVEFREIPNGFNIVSPLVGANKEIDSDADPFTGLTNEIILKEGEINITIDAGLHNPTLQVGAIGDFVWYDRNKDGIQDANENGVAGVTVRLYTEANVLVNTTITNNEGYYIFNNLTQGNYYVNFSNVPPGFKLTLSLEGNNTNIDSDPQTSTGSTGLIAINNNTDLSIDAGIIANDGRKNKGTIGDKVWNDMNQNGIQEEGELGVQGVTATLYQQNGITVITSTQTDALGNYIFTDLDEGNYVVGFSNLPAGFTFSQRYQGNDIEIDANADANSGGKSDVIQLAEGDIDLTIDAGIYQSANLASLGDRVWNDINQNGLQDIGEPGVPGLTITLYNDLGNAVANTTSDANGIYQFTGLIPGTYRVRFTNLPAGYYFTPIFNIGNSFQAMDSDVDPANGYTGFVTLIAGQYNPDIDAGIYTLKASLGDYVWSDVNYDGIQDASEKGISGIVVTLINDKNEDVAIAVTNSVGHYNFVNLEPGAYKVHFGNIPIAGSYSPRYQGIDTTKDSNVDPLTGKSELVTLVQSEYNPTIDAGIHLPTGSGLGNFVWLDLNENGIQDAFETGVPGVTVTLYDINNVAINTAVTDNSGAYSFNNLIPGSYSVGFSTLPTFYQSSGKPYQTYFAKYRQGADDDKDSDADPTTGKTPLYTIAEGEYNPTLDAGITFGFALPALELNAFASLLENGTVHVSWNTRQEMNTSMFEIQRSIDGSTFTSIATKNAAGNTVGVTNYNTIDDIRNIDKKDIIYYRIKLIDIDQKSYLSNVVNVKLLQNNTDVTVYPSPFNTHINVIYNTEVDAQVTVIMLDMNGKVVAQKDAELSAGKNIISIDSLDKLANGIYNVQVIDIDSRVSTNFKVLKQ